MFVANELRSCNYVGIGIWWTSLGHAMTVWGDNETAAPVATNPTRVRLADSDDHPSDPTTQGYDYAWDTDRWRLDDMIGSPYIGQAVVLSPGVDGVVARSGLKAMNRSGTTATNFEFTAWQKEPWIYVLDHFARLDVPATGPAVTESDWPQGDGSVHSIDVEFTDMSVPDGEWIKAECEFILNEWNTVRWKDARFTYDQIPALGAVPDHGWTVDSTKKGFGRGGYVVGAFELWNSTGGFLVEERILHEFLPDVDWNYHVFELENDDPKDTLILAKLRFGYADAYLGSDDFWSFDDWLTQADVQIPLQPGQKTTLELNWNLVDWDNMSVPRPPGDFDGNLVVGLGDFSVFAGSYGSAAGSPGYEAICDLDGNGCVGLGDFSLFAGLYGTTYALATGASVPEPASVAVVSLSLVALVARRRRRA
jgi:hypothetical protein